MQEIEIVFKKKQKDEIQYKITEYTKNDAASDRSTCGQSASISLSSTPQRSATQIKVSS